MNNKILALGLILVFSIVLFTGAVAGISLDKVLNPRATSNSTTTTITSTVTYQENITYSKEYALYGMVFDAYYVFESGESYTVILLLVNNQCCDLFLFDGAVQGVPLGARANIYYREYTVNFIKHMVVTDIEVLSK